MRESARIAVFITFDACIYHNATILAYTVPLVKY